MHRFRCVFLVRRAGGETVAFITVLRSAGLLRSAVNRNSQIARQAGRFAALAEGHDAIACCDEIETTSALAAMDSITCAGVSVCKLIRRITHQREQFRRLCPVQRSLDVRTDKRKSSSTDSASAASSRFSDFAAAMASNASERPRKCSHWSRCASIRGQQIARAAHIVVQMNKQARDRIAARARIRKLIDDSLRRQFVERLRVFRDLRHAAEQSLEGRALRHRLAKRIQRANLQARGMLKNVPTERVGSIENSARQLQRLLLVRRDAAEISVWLKLRGALERAQNAVAHLCRGLAREGNGKYGFRLLDRREAGKKSLHQQFSFSRTCRSLQHP